MKHFEPFEIDFDRCRLELASLKELLDQFESGTLKEREHVLSFFSQNRHLAALIGHLAPDIAHVDRLAFEFDLFGDYAADLALGDSRRKEYCFIEFENAAPDSIFRRVGAKQSLEWAPRFEHGYSQILDWFWKLHDMARTDTGRSRFGHAESFGYYGMLVIGRSQGLGPLERERLNWRRKRVLVDSRHIFCRTFDELYDDLSFKLGKYGLSELVERKQSAVSRPSTRSSWRARLRKRPRRPRF